MHTSYLYWSLSLADTALVFCAPFASFFGPPVCLLSWPPPPSPSALSFLPLQPVAIMVVDVPDNVELQPAPSLLRR